MINDIHTDVDDYLKVISIKDRTVCFQQAKSETSWSDIRFKINIS